MTSGSHLVKGSSRNALHRYTLICRKLQQSLGALIPPVSF
jgi:hypothetical protein